MNCAGRWGRWTGIPVGIGIGPTKTLAKLANRLAKKHPDFLAAGICDLTALSKSTLERYLASLEVGDVWGVGPRWATRLFGLGVYTARDLGQVDPVWVRRHFNGGSSGLRWNSFASPVFLWKSRRQLSNRLSHRAVLVS